MTLGVVVLTVWICSLIVTGLWLVFSYRHSVRGVRCKDLDVTVRYDYHAEEWPDLNDYLLKVRNALFSTSYNAKTLEKVLSFNLVVLPYNRPVITSEIPNGFVTYPDGRQIKVTGSMEVKRFFFGLVKRTFVYVIQNELAPNEIRRSALLHELIEHVLPFNINGDRNAGHARSWQVLEGEIAKRV